MKALFIEIKFDSEIPIYMQIRNEIIKGISIGQLKNGDSLPSVRQMSSMIEVNLHTINKAYNLLKAEGYVRVDRRTGVVIDVKPKEEYEADLEEKMELLLAEAFLMGIEKKKVLKIIEKNFNKFKVGE
ncbi:GntR family transcriptional regulator [uncultured Clostridium sp.]|uniref:GntR family transcriptional regulator n=1 Tax=uncultured Clostridium sp. TaxID=59620 RepID=UPI002614574F|nr:GntR family transcriptional regulator [uncultured Clostridium sp.]